MTDPNIPDDDKPNKPEHNALPQPVEADFNVYGEEMYDEVPQQRVPKPQGHALPLIPHNFRPVMEPLPSFTFDEVYRALTARLNGYHDNLFTDRGSRFCAKPTVSKGRDGIERRTILCTHPTGNKQSKTHVYECCWHNQNSHTGNHNDPDSGTWIAHYIRPLDDWFQNGQP